MAFAQVQAASAQSNGSVASLSLTVSALGSGNLVVVVVSAGGGVGSPTFLVSDGTNTYTSCTGSRKTTATSNLTLETFYAKNSTSGPTTIMVTPSVNATLGIAMEEQSGADTVTPFADATANTGIGIAADSGAIGSVGSWVASGITDAGVFALVAETLTKGTGYSNGSNLGSDGSSKMTIGIEHKTPAAAQHGTWTLSNSARWLANLASFQEASAAVAPDGWQANSVPGVPRPLAMPVCF